MQTQQCGKWTQYKWIVAKKCLQKQKKWKPKQQVGIEEIENKKTMTKNRTTQTKINNVRNEHNTSGLFQKNVYN